MPKKITTQSPYSLLLDFEVDGYNYNSSSNVKLWVDFNETITDRSNLASLISSIEYEGSVPTSTQNIGTQTYNVARFDNSENLNSLITYTSTNNPLSFGDGTSDSAFSVSIWYNRDTTYADTSVETLFEKGDGNTRKEYRATINSTGFIYFTIYDQSSGGTKEINVQHPDVASSISDIRDIWQHFVFTYDGRGGSDAQLGMNIYVNGTLTSPTRSGAGTYTAMEQVSNKFYIGAARDGSLEADGYYAEFAILGEELSQNTISAIYYGTQKLVNINSYNSGYLNNPVRVLLREKDNLLTNYPTVKRLNNKNTKGDNSLFPFNDNFSIAYADEIKDDFNFKKSESRIFFKNIDSKKWEVSSTEKIRRDTTLSSTQDFPNEGSFIFEGLGVSGKRWIKTKTKILNPTVSFNVYQGPYDLSLVGLKLSQGSPEEILKVQTSTDGTTWEDVFINSYNVNNQYFLDASGGYLKPFIDFSNAVLEGNQNNPGLIGISQTTPKNRPICNVSLSMREFNNHGSNSFYLRIVQDAISDQNTRVWAIGDIKITSRNKSVSYPLLLNQGISTERELISSSIASPNQLSQLTVNAASVRNISDNYKFENNSNNSLSPFTDTKTSFSSVPFYNAGVDESTYPGFDQKVLSKTKFEVDLSPSTETTFGYTEKMSQYPDIHIGWGGAINETDPAVSISSYDYSNDNGQQLMVYWNNVGKKWEKIGKPLSYNDWSDIDRPLSNTPNLVRIISQSCVGFSPTPVIGTGSYANINNNIELFSNNTLSLNAKPISTFGFPSSGQYHATSSQFTRAKDVGITKPFLLEKIALNYEGKFELPFSSSAGSGHTRRLLKIPYKYGTENKSLISFTDSISLISPTFFILRQFKDNVTEKININIDGGGADYSNQTYDLDIPGYYQINSGSTASTYVDNNRELITYSTHNIFVTGSNTSDGNSNKVLNYNINDLIDRGLSGDLNTIIEQSSYHTELFSLTSSFEINANVKNSTKLNTFNNIYVSFSETERSSQKAAIAVEKQTGTRNNININNSRGLFNSYNAIDIDKNNNLFIPRGYALAEGFTLPAPTVETIQLDSPYIIMPEDELIFGWQYPMSINYFKCRPGNNSNGFNSLTLFGKSKLTLYGSQIKDNVEFHEGLNQNLITNNVYEVIGSEPVVDQFQIATRGELSGSLLESFPYGNAFGADQLVYGYNIFDEKIFNHALAKNRLTNSVNGDAPGHFTPSILRLISNDASRWAISGLVSKNSFNKICLDTSRRYFDNLINVSSPYKYLNNSYYGLIRSITIAAENEGGYKLTKTGQNENLPLYPKYEFSNKRFGHFADMIEQGKDSKFVNDPTTTADNIVVSPTVKVQFVRSEYDDSGLDVRSFFAIRPTNVNGTTDHISGYQSSNLSLFATSSLPFFDDNIVKNRTYAPTVDGDPIVTVISEDTI